MNTFVSLLILFFYSDLFGTFCLSVIYYIYVLCVLFVILLFFFFFKQKTAYEMRISDWSSDVCSSDLRSSSRYTTSRTLPRPSHANRWSSRTASCRTTPTPMCCGRGRRASRRQRCSRRATATTRCWMNTRIGCARLSGSPCPRRETASALQAQHSPTILRPCRCWR